MVKSVLRLIKISVLASALNLLPAFHWLHEININFSGYYLALHLVSLGVLTILARRLRRWEKFLLLPVLVVLSAYYLRSLAPFYWPPHSPAATGEELPRCAAGARGPSRQEPSGVHPCLMRILYANLNSQSEWSEELKGLIAKEQPDVVALLELSARWQKSLALEAAYPHRILIPRPDNFGLGLFSVFPLAGEALTSVGAELPPVILTELELAPQRRIKAALLHALPPVSGGALEANKILTRRIGTIIRHSAEDVLVAADLNATPFSDYYKRFLWGARLDNAMHGFGLRRSWHNSNALLRMTIDHIFYRGDWRVRRFEVMRVGASDHRPYLVDFELAAAK